MFTSQQFSRFARWWSMALGHPLAFWTATALVVVWAILGPVYGYSEGWQMVINTGTTIATFLMVFLIQNTQNRHGDAIQVKLDELIRAVEGAHTRLVALEDVSDEELKRIRQSYRELAQQARVDVQSGGVDTGVTPMADEPFCAPNHPSPTAPPASPRRGGDERKA